MSLKSFLYKLIQHLTFKLVLYLHILLLVIDCVMDSNRTRLKIGDMELPQRWGCMSGHPSHCQAQSLSLPCHLHLLPIRLGWRPTGSAVAVMRLPAVIPRPPFSRCLTSPCGGMHLPLPLFPSSWEEKYYSPKISCSLSRREWASQQHTHCLIWALLY